MSQQYYSIYNGAINGIWQFKNHKVIAFSATRNIPIERFVNNCICKPKALKFNSEYELLNGMTPVQEGHIESCGSYPQLLKTLEHELIKHYDSKPLIVIHEQDQFEDISKLLRSKRFMHYDGVNASTLH